MRPGARLLVNGDCLRTGAIVERYARHLSVVSFAMACRAPYRADSIERLQPWGYAFDFLHPGGSERIETRVFGRHNVANALCAAAVLCELGFDPKALPQALGRFEPANLRSNAYRLGEIMMIEDCYNASPASTLLVLESLEDLDVAGRLHVVLGDMLELGGDEEAYHRQVGEAAARVRNARVYGVGQRSRWTVEEARAHGAEAEWFETREDVLGALASVVAPGDAVLLKASRLMEFERLAQALRERLGGEGGGGEKDIRDKEDIKD